MSHYIIKWRALLPGAISVHGEYEESYSDSDIACGEVMTDIESILMGVYDMFSDIEFDMIIKSHQ